MIHFVGAGCGASDLITVRGARLLEKADLVVYAGSLVSKDLLNYCRDGIEIYDSAKLNLEEVMELLVSRALEGKEVVRLHTGDPSLYGAIAEQIEILEAKGLEYDVTPGVTAAFGAAASIGTELTLPGITQTIIFTRVEGKTRMPERESIKELSSHGASMAVYLSATRVEELAKQLLEGGYDKDTPVAICYKVSWEDEKIIISTVEKMVEDTYSNNLTLTTLFLISKALKAKDFEKSRLYAADFSTCYREAKNK